MHRVRHRTRRERGHHVQRLLSERCKPLTCLSPEPLALPWPARMLAQRIPSCREVQRPKAALVRPVGSQHLRCGFKLTELGNATLSSTTPASIGARSASPDAAARSSATPTTSTTSIAGPSAATTAAAAAPLTTAVCAHRIGSLEAASVTAASILCSAQRMAVPQASLQRRPCPRGRAWEQQCEAGERYRGQHVACH
jgi:hypothetical protein